MFDNIIIGKYYYGNSVIHYWNSFSKLLCSLFFIITVFFVQKISIMGLFGVTLFLLLLLSDISIRYYWKAIWSIRYFVLFLFLFNCIFQMDINLNLMLMIKLFLVVLYSTMVLYTTPIRELTEAITLLFYPLSFFHIPITLISRMIGLSISFLPILFQESNRLIKTLTVRGIDYKNGTIGQKIYIWKQLLVPLFVGALRHADQVSFTMETRLYDIKMKRQIQWKPFHFFDDFQMIFHLLLMILVWKEGVL